MVLSLLGLWQDLFHACLENRWAMQSIQPSQQLRQLTFIRPIPQAGILSLHELLQQVQSLEQDSLGWDGMVPTHSQLQLHIACSLLPVSPMKWGTLFVIRLVQTKIILLAWLMVKKVNTKERLIRKECQLMMHSVTLCSSGSRGRNIAAFVLWLQGGLVGLGIDKAEVTLQSSWGFLWSMVWERNAKMAKKLATLEDV